MNNSSTLRCLKSSKVINSLKNIQKNFMSLSIQNKVKEGKAQIVACYKVGLRMKIRLEMAAQTYTIDNAYQLAL